MPVRVVQPALLKDAIAEGLCRLTGEAKVSDAWNRILKPDDTILLKFNQSGARLLNITAPFAAVLVEMLTAAGWSPDRIVLLEVLDPLADTPKTRQPDMRWQEEVVQFGKSGSDSFLAALAECTAVINVPFLKTHQLATMTSCLKNLSHGLVRHPARFHANGCDPAIGEIVASPPIRSKLRLHIVNALRVVFDGCLAPRDEDAHNAGSILLSTDPVACDSVGYALLNEVRSLYQKGPLLPEARLPRQLVTASRLGLGVADADRIDVETV